MLTPANIIWMKHNLCYMTLCIYKTNGVCYDNNTTLLIAETNVILILIL